MIRLNMTAAKPITSGTIVLPASLSMCGTIGDSGKMNAHPVAATSPPRISSNGKRVSPVSFLRLPTHTSPKTVTTRITNTSHRYPSY